MKYKRLTPLENKALEQFKKGKSLFGKDGAFAPLLQAFLEKELEAEMEDYLDAKARTGNKRNGKGRKTIRSNAGSFTITTPQDRQSFLSQISRSERPHSR